MISDPRPGLRTTTGLDFIALGERDKRLYIISSSGQLFVVYGMFICISGKVHSPLFGRVEGVNPQFLETGW